ncbi:MAG: hypothetical protein ACM3SU_02400 [Acidobacteriota bacterium]
MSAYGVDHYLEDRREFFRKAFLTLGFNGISGDYAEFGCETGTTFGLAWEENGKAARQLAFLSHRERQNRFFWALDSFRGLPAPRTAAESAGVRSPESLRRALRRQSRLAPDPLCPVRLGRNVFHRGEQADPACRVGST